MGRVPAGLGGAAPRCWPEGRVCGFVRGAEFGVPPCRLEEEVEEDEVAEEAMSAMRENRERDRRSGVRLGTECFR